MLRFCPSFWGCYGSELEVARGHPLPDARGEALDRYCALVLARAQPHGDRPLLLLAGSHHEHVRHLLELGLADAVAQLLVAVVELDPQARPGEGGLHLPA